MDALLIGFSWAIISGFMSIMMFYLTFTQKEKKNFYIFALLFLIASWSGLEYGLWLAGVNMFEMILAPNVPLDFFFTAWIIFVIWAGEKINERKIWVSWIIALIIIFLIAKLCMNCVHF